MPRPGNTPELSPVQAQYVLQRLLQDGRINGMDIRRAVFSMQREIGELEQRLAALRQSAAAVRTGGRPARREGPQLRARDRRRRAQMSPQVIASRKLQGQYIGYMRQLSEKDRTKFADMAKSKGREAAIVAMKKALGK